VDARYPTYDEPASPKYILAVLQDMYRQQCRIDRITNPEAVLSFDTTIAEWREICDLVGWRRLARAHNVLFGISCSDAEWYAVLEPAGERRLKEVCGLIALRAVRPLIRPSRLFGGTCATAGAFLTIRSILHEAGASVSHIAPSTELAPYTREFAGVFLGPVSHLAPGTLPAIRIRTPVYYTGLWGLLVALACVGIGLCSAAHMFTIAGMVMFAACYALTWYAARRLMPASVEFGKLRTFRDLAIVIAKGEPTESGAKAEWGLE
jgi:hypothetical protein